MPRRQALLVGVESCPAADLQGPGNDVALVRGVVGERFGFDSIVVPNLEATRDGILAALDKLVAAAAPDDSLLFYFAGHGTRIEVRDDDEEQLREALCPHDFSLDDLSRGILDYELHERFARAQGRGARMTAIFDCCFSGGLAEEDVRRAIARRAREHGSIGDAIADLVEGPRIRRILHEQNILEHVRAAVVEPIEARPVFRIAEASAVRGSGSGAPVVFGACLADKLAREQRFGDEVHGVFTHHLTEVLLGNEPGLTNVAVRDAVREAVQKACTNPDDLQRAIVSPESTHRDTFLA